MSLRSLGPSLDFVLGTFRICISFVAAKHKQQEDLLFRCLIRFRGNRSCDCMLE